MSSQALAPTAAEADAVLSKVRIVLVRPRGAANVGAAARAMSNLGLGDLVLVRPALRRLAAAERMAVHARALVRNARVVDDLRDAVADCRLIVGTTCRRGGYRAAVEPIDGLACEVLGRTGAGAVAIVFGPEDHGLSNGDLRHCHRLCAIDTSATYPSLNLAQAVLVVCWELRRAALAGAVRAPATTAAPAEAVQQLYDHLERALLAIGFLGPQTAEHGMFALRALFGRAALSDHEVRTLRGVARQIEWAARNGRARPAPEPSAPVDRSAPADRNCAESSGGEKSGAALG